MPRIKLTIEYDGTEYNGWQYQKNNKTIQGSIEQALKTIFKKEIKIVGAGRTDTGVHARNQVAHCDLPETNLLSLTRSLNGILDKNIRVKSAENVNENFNARFDAVKRTYRYYISKEPTAISRKYAWIYLYELNMCLMQYAANELLNLNQFTSFCKYHSSNKTFVCKLYSSKWFNRESFLVYEISADRFLYGMVRAIVGTLIKLGSGRISLKDFYEIINAQKIEAVPQLAPAYGLVLEKVYYDKELY